MCGINEVDTKKESKKKMLQYKYRRVLCAITQDTQCLKNRQCVLHIVVVKSPIFNELKLD